MEYQNKLEKMYLSVADETDLDKSGIWRTTFKAWYRTNDQFIYELARKLKNISISKFWQ